MWGHGMKAFSKDGWLPEGHTSTLVAALYNFDAELAGASPQVGSDRLRDGINWYVGSQLAPNGKLDVVESFLGGVVGSGITGDDPGDISIRGMVAYEGEESGHNSVIDGGYRALVDRLAQGVEIECSTPVQSVEHSEVKVAVVTADQRFEARWAIVTVPLGVLQGGGIRFLPEIPNPHSQALSRIRMKSLEKVVFTFDERFWSEDLSQVALLDDDSGFIWVHDMSAHAGTPTLVALHNPAIAITPTTGEASVQAFAGLMKAMWNDVPDATGTATTSWASDPNALGSYSFIPVGASADDMTVLSAPVGERVFLAGEHTHPSYYGTVQAAWLSGRRVASTVIEATTRD